MTEHTEKDSSQNPSPVSPGGERLKPSSHEILTCTPTHPSRRKEIDTIPSPLGEGQTDTPINHLNQGEVSGIILPRRPPMTGRIK
jgi:hypothetical protein